MFARIVQVGAIIGVFFVIVLLVAMLIATPFMLMWNYAVVAALTVAKPIGFWTAFWLMVFIAAFVAGSNGAGSKS